MTRCVHNAVHQCDDAAAAVGYQSPAHSTHLVLGCHAETGYDEDGAGRDGRDGHDAHDGDVRQQHDGVYVLLLLVGPGDDQSKEVVPADRHRGRQSRGSTHGATVAGHQLKAGHARVHARDGGARNDAPPRVRDHDDDDPDDDGDHGDRQGAGDVLADHAGG